MTQIPAGWYPDPGAAEAGVPQGQRYWDGRQWTEHVQPPPYAAPTPYAPTAPYGAAAQRTTPDGQPLAGWWVRAGAFLLDWLVLTIATVVLAWPFVTRLWDAYLRFVDDVIRAGQSGGSMPSQGDLVAEVVGPLIGFAVVSLVLNFGYNVGFLKWKQATPGKLVLGLRVRLRERAGPLSWRTVLTRWAGQDWYAVAAFVPVVGSVAGLYPLVDDLWPLWDDKNQALHDKLAGTNVVHQRRAR